jgi:RNA recognition motif-containing protein
MRRIADFTEYPDSVGVFYDRTTTAKQRKVAMPRIFIGNIPHASSDVELRYWVESRGFRVESAEVIYDRATGKSRGFGFVALTDEANLQTVIDVLNGQRMDGRVLTVNKATPLYARSEHFVADAKRAPVQDPTKAA